MNINENSEIRKNNKIETYLITLAPFAAYINIFIGCQLNNLSSLPLLILYS